MNQFLKKVLMPFNGKTLKVYATTVLAVLTATAIFLTINTTFGITKEAPRITVGDGNTGTVIVVPAIGDEGYPVAAFCNDERTVVRANHIPDSTGFDYQLVRTVDGKPEMVTWSTGADSTNKIATFYYMEDNAQKSFAAVIDSAAEKCIMEKAGAN